MVGIPLNNLKILAHFLSTNSTILSTPETLTLDNGRSPVAELNELTNALAKWTISERNDDGMIKGYFLTSF